MPSPNDSPDLQIPSDADWMARALDMATRAAAAGEVPVGAVLVSDGDEVASGHNQPIAQNDPTAHAEIVVLREAARRRDNYRLPGTTLYVTLEPCLMCVGAMLHARIERLVYAAPDPKTGALGGCFDARHPALPQSLAVTGGVLAEPCAALLRSFFKARR